MNLLELAFVLGICAFFTLFSLPWQNQSLNLAHHTLAYHLQYAEILALSDDREFLHIQDTQNLKREFPSINESSLLKHTQNSFWQFQLHLGKIYSTSSYSVFSDTPRKSISTNFDSRPMAADVIALDSFGRCVSGYNNTNTSAVCKNNTLLNTRLSERLGLQSLQVVAPKVCSERETARIYFDRFTRAFCSKIPLRFDERFVISLSKKQQKKSLCVLPQGKITSC